jgi:hypothetical protein
LIYTSYVRLSDAGEMMSLGKPREFERVRGEDAANVLG